MSAEFRHVQGTKLPLFQTTTADRLVLYAPGMAVAAPRSEEKQIAESIRDNGARFRRIPEWLRMLRDQADQAAQQYARIAGGSFLPECLTVYPDCRCNLRCVYCFSALTNGAKLRGHDVATVNPAAVYAAADLVARSCRTTGRTMHFGLHGGGEPTLHPELAYQLVNRIRELAASQGVACFAYLATNGMFQSAWACCWAEQFDLISLSWDGTEEVHNRQRPNANGDPTWAQVRATAHEISKAGGHLIVRATITRQSMQRQTELVDFFHAQLGKTPLRFEPAYGGGAEAWGFLPAHAAEFAGAFLAAQKRASELGIPLSFSGVRPREIHGPFCSVLSRTILLMPENSASVCFLGDPSQRDLLAGQMDFGRGVFALRQRRLKALARKALDFPEYCRDCLNVLHCARDCPDRCALDVSREKTNSQGGFRCRLQRMLMTHWILETAEHAPLYQPHRNWTVA